MGKFRLLSEKDAKMVIERLENKYKDSHYYLNFSTPVELLVAAILSAQTRDVVVNSLTPKLFSKYKSCKDFADADEKELLNYINSVTFAENKAKNIIKACKIIEEKYGGKVPNRMEDLLSLPGVGRKTANTILINAFNIVEGIPVDTWVIKLSYRIGLSDKKKQDDIEKDLMRLVDKKYWSNIAYVLKNHGHTVCHSTRPLCEECLIKDVCPKNGV